MDGISRSRGWDKEIPYGVLPMEQLVLSDKWARNKVSWLSLRSSVLSVHPYLQVHPKNGSRSISCIRN